ncbi:MAG: sel1 repeat family protein [Oscillospiraceae bacterium]|nr:sel1 repeat family protein [Oscillospiraceae bacterium]
MEKELKERIAKAEEGDAAAMLELARYYDKNEKIDEAVRMYERAANQDDNEEVRVNAQFELALCLYNKRNTEESKKKAVKLFEKAARQGHAESQCLFGWCHHIGSFVEKSDEEAVKWYEQAAKQADCPKSRYKILQTELICSIIITEIQNREISLCHT